MELRNQRVAIVGAGPAGLAAAYRLQRAGASVTVVEEKGWVGGRTRTDELEGYRVDAGAQLFGSMFTRLFALVDELGMRGEVVRSPGRDALWRGGRAHEVVYGSVASMVTSGGLPLGTKMRLGTRYVPFLNRHTDVLDFAEPERAALAGLDRRSIAEWGEAEMGRDFVEYLVYPQLAAYYGALPEESSEGLYHLLARYGLDVSVFALRRGSGSLCEALAARVREGGGGVRLGERVRGVRVEETAVRLNLGGSEESFDAAVLAVPAPVARSLLAGEQEALDERLADVRFRPALTVGLLLDRPAGVRYFGLSFPREASPTLSAVCVEENKGGELVPAGKGLLVAFVRPDVAPDLVEAASERIVDAVLPELRRAFPGVEQSIVRARAYRWPQGHPTLYPGYLRRLGELRKGAGEPRTLALAGDYQHTSSVEGAVIAGTAAAERLAGRLR